MSVEHVEVLVEEPSAEAFFRVLLPRLLGPISFEIYRHQCKQEMLERLPQRLKGYASWLPANWRILVVLDRDDDDCDSLKANLEQIAAEAKLSTRSKPAAGVYTVVNRIAIEELEAWYFGDWEAVRTAYPKAVETIPAKARYRDPDAVKGGTWEAFERIMQRAGYFKSGLRKIEAARSIAAHIQPDRNRSRSFRVLRDTLREFTR